MPLDSKAIQSLWWISQTKFYNNNAVQVSFKIDQYNTLENIGVVGEQNHIIEQFD